MNEAYSAVWAQFAGNNNTVAHMAYFGRFLRQEDVVALYQSKLWILKTLIHNASCAQQSVRKKPPNIRIWRCKERRRVENSGVFISDRTWEKRAACFDFHLLIRIFWHRRGFSDLFLLFFTYLSVFLVCCSLLLTTKRALRMPKGQDKTTTHKKNSQASEEKKKKICLIAVPLNTCLSDTRQ